MGVPARVQESQWSRGRDVWASRHSFENSIETILIDGVKAGEFKIANTRLSALAWLGLHNYIYIWYRPGGSITVDMIADNFSDTFLHGIVAK